jgi:hypothetical protein
MAACRSFLRKYRKNELKIHLNKTSPRAYTELEFDMLGVFGKLVKYVGHLSKVRKIKKIKFFTQATQTAIDYTLHSF